MQLRRCGVAVEDLSMLYKTVIMPVHEYSYPTWHTGLLTQHDSEIIESIQKRAQYVIFPNINYQEALQTSKL